MGFSPVLQHFRSLLLSLAWGGVQSRSSDGSRDIDAVVSDSFRVVGLVPFSDTHLSLNQRLDGERGERDPVLWKPGQTIHGMHSPSSMDSRASGLRGAVGGQTGLAPRWEAAEDRRSGEGKRRHWTAGLTGSWRVFRSAVVPVESPSCQRHPQLAWTSTNPRAEPSKGQPPPPPCR